MSVKIKKNVLLLKNETTGKMDPVDMVGSGSDKTLKEISDYANQKKAEVKKTVERAIESIPDDYIELSQKVDNLNQGGLNLEKDFIGEQVNGWLDEHPEATTTVQDGAIEESKINTNFLPWIKKDYVTPEMFGAVGDSVHDDTEAIEKAINTKKKIIGQNKYFTKEGLKIIDDFIDITLNALISDSDAITISSSYGMFKFNLIDSKNGVSVKLLGNGQPVIFNKISCNIAYAETASVELSYTDATNENEYVNENDITINAMHSPIGIRIDGANARSCNSNIFHRPDFELCKRYGIWMTGESTYNKFLNCRNEEIAPNRTLIYIDGNVSSNVLDCNMPVYPDNFKCSDNAKNTLNRPNILPNGIFTNDNIILSVGESKFCVTSNKK